MLSQQTREFRVVGREEARIVPAWNLEPDCTDHTFGNFPGQTGTGESAAGADQRQHEERREHGERYPLDRCLPLSISDGYDRNPRSSSPHRVNLGPSDPPFQPGRRPNHHKIAKGP
jgi:hypothetical protein